MITPAESHSQWDGDDPSKFVRFPVKTLECCGVPAADSHFQWVAGLPAWAAPNMHFFFDGGEKLPPPCDPNGIPLSDAPNGLCQIGSTGEDFPICIDSDGAGRICCLEIETGLVKLLNSSLEQLIASLLAFNKTVAAALAYGEKHHQDDAWRKGLYPVELDQNLQREISLIDPDGMRPGSYWFDYFTARKLSNN